MLARTFLSHETLGITEKEQSALIKVLGMLEREEIPHATDKPIGHIMSLDFKLTHFNMAEISHAHKCGTVGCLLGWARFIADDRSLMRHHTDELANLFCMGGSNREYRGKYACDITPTEAATALRNYLATGKAQWREVILSNANA